LAAAFAVAAPAAAEAALHKPILTGTNPASPGASTTPRILGQIEEVEIKVVDPGSLWATAAEPNNTVKLYTQSGCLGPVAGEGTAGQLEAEGILVSSSLAPESVTTFYATQENSEEVSACSSPGLTYRQVSSAPGAPGLASVTPASGSNDNFPRFGGSADPESTVLLYSVAGCTGSVVGSGSGAEFAAAGIQVSVADNSETNFSAKATMAGFSSPCSAGSITYREVTPPPPVGGGGSGGGGTTAPPQSRPAAPHLRTVPKGSANDNTPVVTGTAPGAATVKIFASPNCSGPVLAKGPAATFATAGLPVQVADNTALFLSAVAVSAAGESPCSDPIVYVEDSTAPRTRITMGPAAKTAKRKAVFRFTDTTGDAPGTTFFCKIDKAKWKPCSSPLKMKHLHPRRYVLQVKATDPAGNVELRGTKRSFKVIRHP
jgi:hypothetical protein